MSFMQTLPVLFSQVIWLVSNPPGSLVYHLVVLFAFQAAAAIAFARWRSGLIEGRLFWAAAGLFVVRLVLLVATLLAAASLVPPLAVIPPLDRAASTLTVLLIIWAFAFPKTSGPADAVTAALALIILIGLGISWGLWLQNIPPLGTATAYNGSAQESVWEIAQIALLLVGAGLLIIRRAAAWYIGLTLTLMLLVVHVLQLFLPLSGDVPGLVRLVEIVALPMFTALVYRSAHAPLASAGPAAGLVTLPASAALSPSAVSARALVALASINAAADLDQRRQNLILALAHLFQADLSLLILPPGAAGVAPVACCYRVSRGQFTSRPDLPLAESPAVAAAFQTQGAMLLNATEHEAELHQLAAGCGLEGMGFGLLAPLAAPAGTLAGVVALLASAARPAWTVEDQDLLGALTQSAAAGFDAADQLTAWRQESRSQQARADAADQQRRAIQETAEKMMNELAQAQSAVSQLTAQLTQTQSAAQTRVPGPTEAERRRRDEERNRLEVELEAAQEGLAALALLQGQYKSLSGETEALRRTRAELESEVERLRGDLQSAQGREQHEADLAATVDRTQTELREARERQAALEKAAEAAQAQIRDARAALADKEASLQQCTLGQQREAQAAAQAASQAAELERARAELQQRVMALEQTGRQQAALLAETQTALAAAQAALAEETLKLNDLTQEGDRREAEWTSSLEQTRAELQRTVEQRASLEKAAQDEQAQRQEAQAALSTARSAIAGQAAAFVATQEKLAEKERELSEALGKLQAPPTVAMSPEAQATLERVATLAQDLRQPVMSISGYVSLLLGESVGLVGSVQKKFLERIQASCERLEVSLNDLAQASEAAFSARPLTMTRVDVTKLMEEALQASEALLREKGIHLRLELAENLPLLLADAAALRRVFSGLIHNAASATPLNGEVRLMVRREVQTSGGEERSECIFVSVKDSGSGLTPEDLPKVFFGSSRLEAPLAGLGDTGRDLVTLQPLVEAHGGRIWVTSEPGHGSLFSVLLPVTDRPVPLARQDSSAGSAEPPLPTAKALDFLVLPPDSAA